MKRPVRRVLVIAAHPDDEVLGCGGTLALHARAGDEVHAAIACEGESLRYGPEGVGQSHHMEQAAQTLGLQDVRLLGFPDQRLDTVTLTDIIAPLEQRVRDVRPDIVYCQYGGDVNRDHELLFKAALVATRPTENCIAAIYAFDTASSTEWAFPAVSSPTCGWKSLPRSRPNSPPWRATRASSVPILIPARSMPCATGPSPGGTRTAWRLRKCS